MKLSGKTPLVRAINLEKLLKIKKIYLKLEGANPTGHKYARIAEIMCKDALAHDQKTMWIEGSKEYLKALNFFCDRENIKIKVPRFKKESWKKAIFDPTEIVDLRNRVINDPKETVMELAGTNEFVAYEGFTQKAILMMSLEEMTEEIIERLPDIDSIYTQSNYGHTLSSMYNVFLKAWIHEEKNFPEIFTGIDEHQIPKDVDHGKPLIIKAEELKAAKGLLRNQEHIYASEANLYPLAAFLQQVRSGYVKDGTHVIVLNDAKSKITIRQIDSLKGENVDLILGYVNSYLSQYGDPDIEVKDAIKNAIDKGYVLLAEQGGENLGVCVVVNTQFEDFIPTYHLAYLGTSRSSRGRGIGTELIKQAIDKTGGKLSLHVDLDNKTAKKLYEKMGFKHAYNRMIYYGDK
ncbi:MAG: GNAT family N-acetyltransferase [Bacilli bacterium]|nr:GNAT family N-acetyltransferase [Bacilli bacterium]